MEVNPGLEKRSFEQTVTSSGFFVLAESKSKKTIKRKIDQPKVPRSLPRSENNFGNENSSHLQMSSNAMSESKFLLKEIMRIEKQVFRNFWSLLTAY